MTDGSGTEGNWSALLAEASWRDGPMLYRLAYGVLRDREAAEDVCQQALLKAWQQRETIRRAGALRSWLSRVVINDSFAVLRRRRTEQRAMDDSVYWRRQHENPADGVAQRDMVLRALERLNEPTRSIVVMRVMQGMSGNEVASTLGYSAPEISRRLHRGMEHMRTYLHGSVEGEGALESGA